MLLGRLGRYFEEGGKWEERMEEMDGGNNCASGDRHVFGYL